MVKSLYGGVQDLAYAVGDRLTSGIDAAMAYKSYRRSYKKYTRKTKIEDPETLTGRSSKLLTQYGVPGGAVFKILNRGHYQKQEK